MRLVGKIIKPLLSIIGILLLVALVLFWIAILVALFVGMPITQFIYPGSGMTAFLGTFNILTVIGIPLLMIALFIMRVFLKSNFRPKWQFGLWAFWFINLISLSLVAMMTAKDFQHGEEKRVSEEAFSLPSDTLHVEMERSPFYNSWFRIGDEFIVSDEKLVARSIRVSFEKSSSGQLEIIQKNESRGVSLSEANQLAESIGYAYHLDGNRLILPSYFTIQKGEKWRGQHIHLNILVPEGMYVERNGHLSNRIDWVRRDNDYKFPRYRQNNYTWRMGPKGMTAPGYDTDRKKEFNFSGFSKIRVDGRIELDIRQGNHFNVVLDETDRPHDIEVNYTDGRLDLSTKGNPRETFHFNITMPRLEELWVVESKDIEIRDFKLQDMHIVNEGDGDINAFADIQNLNIHLTGNNELNLRGEGNYLSAILSDHSELDAEHFSVKKASMEVDNKSLAKSFCFGHPLAKGQQWQGRIKAQPGYY